MHSFALELTGGPGCHQSMKTQKQKDRSPVVDKSKETVRVALVLAPERCHTNTPSYTKSTKRCCPDEVEVDRAVGVDMVRPKFNNQQNHEKEPMWQTLGPVVAGILQFAVHGGN